MISVVLWVLDWGPLDNVGWACDALEWVRVLGQQGRHRTVALEGA